MLLNPIYKEWIEAFSNEFINDNNDILAKYSLQWVNDPLHSWSRGWEYTFVAAAIRKYAPRDRDLFLLDVGSGVTFIDWMVAYDILKEYPRSRVIALDSNTAYQDWFHQINKRNAIRTKQGNLSRIYTIPKVQFMEYDIQKGIPLPYNSIDIAFCISVMEHVHDTVTAAKNIFETIAPGGYLIITFDIDINGGIVDHHPAKADVLIAELHRISKEIQFDDGVLRTYNNALFRDDIEKKNDLYTLYEGAKRGLDDSAWINTQPDRMRKGLFFSCHVFQKPL